MIEYQSRTSLLDRDVRYTLIDDGVACSAGPLLAFSDIDRIRLYSLRGGVGMMHGTMRRCVISPRRGRPIVLTSYYFRGVGNFEPRTEAFRVFVAALIEQTAAANPGAGFVAGMPLPLWWLWAVVLAASACVIPLTIGLIALDMAEPYSAATSVIALVAVTVMALLSIYFLRPLTADWPRTFNPRLTDVGPPSSGNSPPGPSRATTRG